jgi:hypothetical protein
MKLLPLKVAVVVVVVHGLPPLGLVTLTARRGPGYTMSKHSGVNPEMMGVRFERRGVAVTEPGAGARAGAWLSAASYTSPRDDHFGDGPYVSRSGVWHAMPLWLGEL